MWVAAAALATARGWTGPDTSRLALPLFRAGWLGAGKRRGWLLASGGI